MMQTLDRIQQCPLCGEVYEYAEPVTCYCAGRSTPCVTMLRPITHALSIRQPWAWAIIRPDVTDVVARAELYMTGKIKDIENRSWPTNRTGRVFVHAGKAWGRDEREDLELCRDLYPDLPWPEKYELGGIVGSVMVRNCVFESPSRWFSGPYGFVLSKAVPTPFIPLRGMLNFFPVPSGIAGR